MVLVSDVNIMRYTKLIHLQLFMIIVARNLYRREIDLVAQYSGRILREALR